MMVASGRMPIFFILIVLYQLLAYSNSLQWRPHRYPASPSLTTLRGGDTSSTILDDSSPTSAKKRKRKKRKKTNQTEQSKEKVNEALKETDAAGALGDAIRSKAEELRQEATTPSTPLLPELQHIQESVRSVGLALGASDQHGVEVDPASVLAHYFLKSHGGAHGLQCICSVLAAATGVGALLFKGGNMQLSLIQRCMVFAMIKHVAGLLAASFIAAKSIPLSGYRRAADLMSDLAQDPVSQYVFYAADILLWLPRGGSKLVDSKTPPDVPSTVTTVWWQSRGAFPFLLVAPVVLREVISTALVVSDVLVLWATTAENPGGTKKILAVLRAFVNAGMSLLVTPSVWKSADAAERQAILARITSRASLAFEVAVGLLLTADCVISTAGMASGGGGPLRLLKRFLCTRLYLQFLWTRRKKIRRLASTLRGGARHVPFYILDVLMDPQASVGWEKPQKITTKTSDEWTWKDIARFALDID